MTTDVKVTCNGSNYRAVVVDSRYPDKPTYVYSGQNGEPNPVSHHGVGSDSQITVTEEYSTTGWNRETHAANPAAEMTGAAG